MRVPTRPPPRPTLHTHTRRAGGSTEPRERPMLCPQLHKVEDGELEPPVERGGLMGWEGRAAEFEPG
jgi:hypothetical protein